MSTTESDAESVLQRIDGRLHSIQKLRDEAGKVVGTVARPLKVELQLEDLGQLVAGAFVMAVPLAFTGEVWDLGESISTGGVMTFLGVSLVVLAGFIWSMFYGNRVGDYRWHFLARVATAYLVTLVVALFLVAMIDPAPLEHFRVTLNRAIIIAFPASFVATAVDFAK